MDTTLSYIDTLHRFGDDHVRDTALDLRPGFQITSNSGRIRGSMSYGLDAIYHTTQTDASSLQNSLNAAFTADIVQGRAGVDVTANVSQQVLSPFGQQSTSNLDVNSNRNEVASLSVAPHVQGLLGTFANYSIQLTGAATNVRHSIVGDSTSQGASASLASGSGFAIFGWGLQASEQRSKFRAGRPTTSDSVSASVSARPNPELQLSVNGGRESNTVEGTDRQSNGTWGWNAHWVPSERTSAVYSTEHRYFGQSHSLTFEHRMPVSSIRFTSTRDTSTSPGSVSQPVTAYQLLDFQLTSAYPDPVARDQIVLATLRSLGTDPNTVVIGGYVNSAATVQTREDLAWTYVGKRLTLTLQAFSSSSTVIDSTSPQANEVVRQTGYTATLSHRLTPTASINLTGSRLMTPSTSTQAGNGLKSLTLGWSDQLGRRTTANLSARYSAFNSTTDPYREVAITASVGMRF